MRSLKKCSKHVQSFHSARTALEVFSRCVPATPCTENVKSRSVISTVSSSFKTIFGKHSYHSFFSYRRLHLPVNARAKNMFSRDVKRLSFRCQTLKFSRPNVKFYFSTLISATAQREDVFNQQERTKLSERRPTFKQFT